jgi:hypothetical protein
MGQQESVIIGVTHVDEDFSLQTTTGTLSFNKNIIGQRYIMLPSDYGINEYECADSSLVNSMVGKKVIAIDLHIPTLSIDISPNFEYIEFYGGRFNIHSDKQRYEGHDMTIILYPPDHEYDDYYDRETELQNRSKKGGDFIIYDNNNIERYRFRTLPNCWSCIIFPIHIKHSSSEVVYGVKRMYKSTGVSSMQHAQISAQLIESVESIQSIRSIDDNDD